MAERKDPQRERAASQFSRWMAATNASVEVLDPFKRPHSGVVSVTITDEQNDAIRDTEVNVNLKKATEQAKEHPTTHTIWTSSGANHLSLIDLGLPYMRGRDGRAYGESVYAQYAQLWLDHQAAKARERNRRSSGGVMELVQFVPVLNVVADYNEGKRIEEQKKAEDRRFKERVAAVNAGFAEMEEDMALETAAVPFAREIKGALGNLILDKDSPKWERAAVGWALDHLIHESPSSSKGVPTRRVGPGVYVVDHEKGSVHHGVRGAVDKALGRK